MGVPVKYLMPYQLDILAHDAKSGKRIGNTLYFRSGTQVSGAPAYGDPVPGASDTDTLLTNIATAWEVLIAATLSINYTMSSYTLRDMVSYGFSTVAIPIATVSFTGTQATFTTVVPHGLTTLDNVVITGLTATPTINATYSVIVNSSVSFTVAYTGTGPVSGFGFAQKAGPSTSVLYGNVTVKNSTATGNVTGDSLPTYAAVDVQRINPGTGKSFRSHISMATIGEADEDFGKLNSTAITTWNAALAVFLNASTGYSNGGSTASSNKMFQYALSHLKMFGTPKPITSAIGFSAVITAMTVHANLGTQLKRKVKVGGS